MKIVKTITKEYEFFPEQERQRLVKNFVGEQLQRQLDILAAFCEKGVHRRCKSDVLELYDTLPYDDDNCCSEKEYIGSWYGALFYDEQPLFSKEIKVVKEEKILGFY